MNECEWGETSGNSAHECDVDGRFLKLSIEGTSNVFLGTAMPPEMGLMSSLSFLQLTSLNMVADIANLLPPEFSNAPLKTLFLQLNELTGALPSRISSFRSLTNLNVYRNQLTGTLPTEMGLLQNLRFLTLYDNLFSGPIPSELGLITTLESILVDRTDVTGTVPTELCALTSLRSLRVDCAQVSCPEDCDCTCYVET